MKFNADFLGLNPFAYSSCVEEPTCHVQGLFCVDQDIDTVVKYLFRAEHARAIAEDTHEKKARDILLGLAADYDRMALSMERIARADLHLNKSFGP